ncbi:hypothetical protein ACWKWU_03170 [Chitinophaga lutea]
MTLEQQIKDLILQFFIKYGIKHRRHDRISLMMTRYFNFRLKYIPVQPWQVKVSKELSEILKTHELTKSCGDIFLSAASGKNLNPHQSRRSLDADYHDRLFNDWGIHHLHVSLAKKNPTDFFCERTGPLLFARFHQNTAYFLNIQEHSQSNAWSNTDLIRIMQKNWPTLLEDREVRGTKFAPHLSDEEIGVLRKKGYTVGINVDSKAYLMLGHGQTSSGDNMMASRMSDEVWRWVGSHRELYEIQPDAFINELKKQLHIN